MPNPLTDELSNEAKAELAAVFAGLKRHYAERDAQLRPPRGRPAWLSVGDRPHRIGRW
jgi:hypothetical protein